MGFIILNNNSMAGLSLQQLQAMGAQPVPSNQPAQKGQTLQQLLAQQRPIVSQPSSQPFSPIKSFVQDSSQILQGAGQDITKSISDIPANAAKAGGSLGANIASVGQAAGNVAGDVAGATSGLIGNAISAFIPKTLKDTAGNLTQGAAKVINDIPGMTDFLNHVNTLADKNPEIVKSLGNVVNTVLLNEMNKTSPTVSDAYNTVKGGIKDAINTPVVTPKTPVAGDKFINELVTPKQTAKTMTQNIKMGNVQEGGLLSGRTIEPTRTQVQIQDAVKTVPGISESNTLLQNSNAIHDAIGTTAQDLKNQLFSREIQPIVTQEKWQTFLDTAKASVSENPLLTGDAEATANKIINKFKSLLPQQGDITANDVLDARQSLDRWMNNQKGGSIFDPAKETAVSTGLRIVRQGANDLLSSVAEDVPVKELLKKQSLLYDAIDNIAPKAAKEAGSTIGRVVQTIKKHPAISTGASIVGADVILHKLGI